MNLPTKFTIPMRFDLDRKYCEDRDERFLRLTFRDIERRENTIEIEITLEDMMLALTGYSEVAVDGIFRIKNIDTSQELKIVEVENGKRDSMNDDIGDGFILATNSICHGSQDKTNEKCDRPNFKKYHARKRVPRVFKNKVD